MQLLSPLFVQPFECDYARMAIKKVLHSPEQAAEDYRSSQIIKSFNAKESRFYRCIVGCRINLGWCSNFDGTFSIGSGCRYEFHQLDERVNPGGIKSQSAHIKVERFSWKYEFNYTSSKFQCNYVDIRSLGIRGALSSDQSSPEFRILTHAIFARVLI